MSAPAQAKLSDCGVPSGYACGQCEGPMVNAIDGPGGLISQARDGRIDSVENFLAAIKSNAATAPLLKNTIMVNNSRSAQVSDAKSGDFRYLLKSPESEIAIGMTNAKGKGRNVLEFVLWNGKDGRYEMRSLCFPKEGPCPDQHATLPSVEGHGDQPPESCIQCHHNPPRPNWDTYRFWSGSIPYNPDHLEIGSEESNWYIETLNRTRNDPRLKYLEPPKFHNANDFGGGTSYTGAAGIQALPKGTVLQLEHDPRRNISGFGPENDPPSVRYFDQSSFRNTCRIATEQKKLPTKYAFVSAFRCTSGTDPDKDFIPPERQAEVASYFKSRGITDKDGKVTLDAVIRDTRRRANRHYIRKLALQLDSMIARFKGDQAKAEAYIGFTAARLKSLFDSPEASDRRFGSSDVTTPGSPAASQYGSVPENKASEADVRAMAQTRMLLEPMGVNVGDWSMSVDFGHPQIGGLKFYSDNDYDNRTYTFADIYSSYMADAPLLKTEIDAEYAKEVPGGSPEFCQWLAQKSRDALKTGAPKSNKTAAPPQAANNRNFADFYRDCKAGGSIPNGKQVPEGVAGASAATVQLLRSTALKLLDDKCMACHDSGDTSTPTKPGDAPNFASFDPKDGAALKSWLNSKSPYGTRTWLEVFAEATDANHADKSVATMPQGDSIKADDRALILGFLSSSALSADGTGAGYACEALADRLSGNPVKAGSDTVHSTPRDGAAAPAVPGH